MIFQACLVILVASTVIFQLSAGENGLVKRSNDSSGSGGGGGGRYPRPESAFDLNDAIARDVVDIFNYERSLTGASNMNYVDWALHLESAVITWASGCDYDAHFNLPYPSYNLRFISETGHTLTKSVQELLNSPELYYGMRSIYVTGICAVKMFCSAIIVNGTHQLMNHLYLVVLPHTSEFNASVPQYTLGPPCSNCLTGVEWCYYNLCREKCDFSTIGCCKITASKTLECSAPALGVSRSHSCRINPSVKLEIMLLGLLSVLFAIIW